MEIVLLDTVNCLFETGYAIRDSKANSVKLIKFTNRFECVWFFHTLDGYLIVGTLLVEGIIVIKALNFVDEIISPWERVHIEMGESVMSLAVINN